MGPNLKIKAYLPVAEFDLSALGNSGNHVRAPTRSETRIVDYGVEERCCDGFTDANTLHSGEFQGCVYCPLALNIHPPYRLRQCHSQFHIRDACIPGRTTTPALPFRPLSNILQREDFGTVLDGKPFIPSLWLGLWTGAGPIGAIIGAVCAGRLQDLLGRRASLITGTLISSIAIAACFVANLAPSLDTRRGVFLAVNLVEGIGTTMIYCTAQTYISEVAPVLLRSTLLTCLPVFTLLGQLLGAIVTFALLQVHGSWSYRAAYASQWILSAVVLLVAILIPESPVFLIRKSSLEEARAAQFRLCPASVNDDFACLMRTIQNEVDSHGGEKVGYRDCFKGTNHRRTWIVVFANCIPILFGLPLLANSSYFLQIVGLVAGDAFRVLIIGIAVGMMANFVAMWTLSHFGRRPLIIVSLVTAGALWTSVGIAGFWDSSISAW